MVPSFSPIGPRCWVNTMVTTTPSQHLPLLSCSLARQKSGQRSGDDIPSIAIPGRYPARLAGDREQRGSTTSRKTAAATPFNIFLRNGNENRMVSVPHHRHLVDIRIGLKYPVHRRLCSWCAVPSHSAGLGIGSWPAPQRRRFPNLDRRFPMF